MLITKVTQNQFKCKHQRKLYGKESNYGNFRMNHQPLKRYLKAGKLWKHIPHILLLLSTHSVKGTGFYTCYPLNLTTVPKSRSIDLKYWWRNTDSDYLNNFSKVTHLVSHGPECEHRDLIPKHLLVVLHHHNFSFSIWVMKVQKPASKNGL